MLDTRQSNLIASQADRAVFAIKSAMKECGECGEMCHYIVQDLFDKIISPILLYGSEIWEYGALDMQGLLNMYIEN